MRDPLHPLKRTWGKYLSHLPRKRRGLFQHDGVSYPYFCHRYNQTWMSERCIEVPLAIRHVVPGARILELGRVLDHYFDFPHDCVDKFEKGAQNVDIVNFKSDKRYDLIITISTLEHVGWDEARDPDKIFRAIEVLKEHLAPGGKLVATVPFGYNTDLQKSLLAGRRLFDEQSYFARDAAGDWHQTAEPEFLDYNRRDGWANALLYGVTRKD